MVGEVTADSLGSSGFLSVSGPGTGEPMLDKELVDWSRASAEGPYGVAGVAGNVTSSMEGGGIRLPDPGLFTGLTDPCLSVTTDRLLDGDGLRSICSTGRSASCSPILAADLAGSGLRKTLNRLARRPSTLPRLSFIPLCAERIDAVDGSTLFD